MNTSELLMRLNAAYDDAQMRKQLWEAHSFSDPMIERLCREYSELSVTIHALIARYQGDTDTGD